jgi:hypothetical protein
MIRLFLVGFVIRIEKVRKEEKFQDGKHDEQFNEENEPKPFSQPAHSLESIGI